MYEVGILDLARMEEIDCMHRLMANGRQMSKMIAISDMRERMIDDKTVDTSGHKIAKCSPCRVEVFSA